MAPTTVSIMSHELNETTRKALEHFAGVRGRRCESRCSHKVTGVPEPGHFEGLWGQSAG
jgi:hypothetical protein